MIRIRCSDSENISAYSAYSTCGFGKYKRMRNKCLYKRIFCIICNRMTNFNFNPYIAFIAFKNSLPVTWIYYEQKQRQRHRAQKPQRFSMFLPKHHRPRSPSPSHSHRVRWPFNRVRVWRWLVRPSTIAIIARHCPRDRPTMILLMQPDITFCSLLSAICILRASAKKKLNLKL